MAVEKALALIALKRTEQIGDISDAVEAAQAAQTAAETAQGKAEDAAELAEETVASKADIDGYYANMTVGNAEQLISDDYVTDQTPYTFRTAGGNVDIGDREYDELVGGTIAWNQEAPAPATGEWTFGTFSNGVMTYTATFRWQYTQAINGTRPIKNHVYILAGDFYFDTLPSAQYRFDAGNSGYQSSLNINLNTEITTAQKWSHVVKLNKYTINDSATIGTSVFVQDFAESGWVTVQAKNIQFFDLTAMFGTAIADHIYALEQATAGAGVAWFRTHFPKDYYAYDPGSLQSVQAASHDMVGFNAYDNTTGTATLLGGNQYQITGTYTALAYSTGETITPDSNGLFTPSANGTLTVTGGNATDTCVHLVWSGYRNGEYEPYEKNSYPLDSTLTLRGIPKLDASNNLVYDGDTYEADGTVTRKYKEYTENGTGSVNCFLHSSGNYYTTIILPETGVLTGPILRLVNSYGYTEKGSVEPGNIYITGGGNTLVVVLQDQTVTTAAAAKTYLASHPLTIVYELATSTTETADPFQSPQIVNDFGTEEYTDAGVAAGTRDVAIPVGHETRYIANLVDKLRRLPNAPDSTGSYLVSYSTETRRMSLSEYLDGAKVTALEGKVPDAPTTDGTYVLTATVSDGAATYSWESNA